MLGVCLKYEQINYGSKLQALATVRMLEAFGKEYEILRFRKDLRFYVKAIPRFWNYAFLNDRYDQIQRSMEYRRHPEIAEMINLRNGYFAEFDKKFENKRSKLFSCYEELQEQCAEKYTAVLTCSDQLWSPAALGSGFYNLMFAPEEMCKISWASSFGVSQIPWYQRKRTAHYLNRIQHISMRENRGAEIVKDLTGREVPVLMDPVFLFCKEEWEKMVPVSTPEWEPYIFCYFLGDNPEYRAIARELARRTGRKIVTLRHLDRYIKEDESFGDYAPYDVGPQRFLNILRNAECICTDSFHGMAFSIICEKPFVVFDRYSNTSANSKNSRIDSVCKNLSLETRRFSEGCDIATIMRESIDYNAVREQLQEYRQRTINYLENALLVEE